jgi:hypothetical protein
MVSLWRLLGRHRGGAPRRVRLQYLKCRACRRWVWLSNGDTQCLHCTVRQLPRAEP